MQSHTAAPAPAPRHVAKRARRDKSVEAVFDEASRREFLTGFQKRKNQRRKAAEKHLEEKARRARLDARKQVRSTPPRAALSPLSPVHRNAQR